jgi:hypothetical protein
MTGADCRDAGEAIRVLRGTVRPQRPARRGRWAASPSADALARVASIGVFERFATQSLSSTAHDIKRQAPSVERAGRMGQHKHDKRSRAQ